jgi:HSP20 family protein
MNLIKWDPFRELEGFHARLNRLFGESPARPDDEGLLTNWVPPVDIQETDQEYVVKADLPDIKKDDVKVELNDGVLTVKGERKQEKEEKGKRFHRTERTYGEFMRRFVLPTEVDAPKVAADFKDGVLTVHLPKNAAAKPKAVEIKVA